MNDKRRICVATGSRADYGLLYWLLWELQRDRDVELLIVATGAHLSPSFGHTVDEIRRDGFDVACEIEMLLAGDSPVAVAKSMGLGVIGFADAFAALRPDILCLLGDRFEMLAAAQAAMVARIPIAHIHGGEATEGLIDEAIRHCLTKMSHLHFCAAEAYRRRIVQMGEDPSRVWNVGAAGIDQIARCYAALGIAVPAVDLLDRLRQPRRAWHPSDHPACGHVQIGNPDDLAAGRHRLSAATAANRSSHW